jgi:hypothetical protein
MKRNYLTRATCSAFICFVTLTRVHAQIDLGFDVDRVVRINTRFSDYGGLISAIPRGGKNWDLQFTWEPHVFHNRENQEFPDLSNLGIRQIFLRSSYVPDGLIVRLQAIDSPIVILKWQGGSVEDKAVIDLLSGMKNKVVRLELECPKLTPRVLQAVDPKKVGHVILVSRNRKQRVEFRKYVEESEKKLVSLVLVSPLSSSAGPVSKP